MKHSELFIDMHTHRIGDAEAAKKYPFEMTGLPQLRREDGSFTNW